MTQAFTATQVATRRRQTFLPGKLIVLVDGSELPSEARFIRLNGLRPSQGVECRYVVGSDPAFRPDRADCAIRFQIPVGDHLRFLFRTPTTQQGTLPPGQSGNTLNQLFSSSLGTTAFGYVLPQILRWVWFGGSTSR